MIPSIEQIIGDLLAGDISQAQAVTYLHQHIEDLCTKESDDGLRDMFAGLAMQGLLSCQIQPQSGADMYARDAYEVADAMMEARNKS